LPEKGRHRFRKSGIVIGDHPTSNHPFDFDVGVFFCGFCKVIFFSNKPQDIETGQSSPLPGSTRLPPSDVAGSNPACECECGDGLFAGWTVAVCGRKGFFMVTHVVSSVHSWIQWDIMGI
jgi:hypothetical protein